MESSGQIRVLITLLVNVVDRTKPQIDPRYNKLLLDGDDPIQTLLTDIEPDEHEHALKGLFQSYIKYEWVDCHLAGARSLASSILELVYVTNLNYLPGMNKSGTIYTYEELQNRKIIIDEYYERALRQFGPRY